MKKILCITWSISYGYGTEKSLADVCNRMDKTKYEIHILPLFRYADTTIFNKHIKILDALIDYTQPKFDEQKALQQYYDLLANPLRFQKRITETYDCIIACNHNAPSYFASYLHGGTKIAWIRGDMQELNYHAYEPDTEAYQKVKQEYDMQANVFGCFDALVVISDVVQQSLADLFHITEHVFKISNSVDSEKIKLLAQETVPLPKQPLFTCIGRLDSNKNQMLLLQAVKEVKKQHSDFMVYLLGDGEDRQKLETYIKQNQLQNHVKILGFVENPYPYIKHSIATVLTSLSEGFSLALVESVLLQTPIITTNVGIAQELIGKYHCGELISYDAKTLATAMCKYLNQTKGYTPVFSIGNAYDIKTEVQKTVRLIEQTIQDNAPQPKTLPYPQVTISAHELEQHEIPKDSMYLLRILQDGVPYEYLIHQRSGTQQLIVFHNGAIANGNVTEPIFQRHSWAKMLKTSAIFCMDPTLYCNRMIQVGWGIGKNETYYLEQSAWLLQKIMQKMGILPQNTVIYGTSAGGYLSIMTGIYLKGAKVVADNAQLDIKNWVYKDALDTAITFCFDNIGDALRYPERFSVVQAFAKQQYVPKLYLHVNLCSDMDNAKQLVPFLEQMAQHKTIQAYHDIEIILHYAPTKGHNGLDIDEAIPFLYDVLDKN